MKSVVEGETTYDTPLTFIHVHFKSSLYFFLSYQAHKFCVYVGIYEHD